MGKRRARLVINSTLENLQLPTFSLTVTNASIILLRRHIQLIAISDNSLEIFCSIDECCNVVNVIQDELGFEALTDIWAIDLLFRNVKKRFAVTVALRNIISGARIRITPSLRENALASHVHNSLLEPIGQSVKFGIYSESFLREAKIYAVCCLTMDSKVFLYAKISQFVATLRCVSISKRNAC